MAIDIIHQTHNVRQYTAREDGKIIVGEAVDVEGNLDRVQRLRQAEINNETLGHCIASIPLAAIAQWGMRFGLDVHQVMNDDKLLDRCIADYGKFKVRGGWV